MGFTIPSLLWKTKFQVCSSSFYLWKLFDSKGCNAWSWVTGVKNKGLNRRFCNGNENSFCFSLCFLFNFIFLCFFLASIWYSIGGKKAVEEGLGLSVCFTVIVWGNAHIHGWSLAIIVCFSLLLWEFVKNLRWGRIEGLGCDVDGINLTAFPCWSVTAKYVFSVWFFFLVILH